MPKNSTRSPGARTSGSGSEALGGFGFRLSRIEAELEETSDFLATEPRFIARPPGGELDHLHGFFMRPVEARVALCFA